MYLSIGEEAQSCLSMRAIIAKHTFGDGIITDFVNSDKASLYDLNNIPDNDFRFDTSFRLMPNAAMSGKNTITFSVTGENGDGNR